MAIVRMSKFSLFSFDSDRQNLLNVLQKFKYIHFNTLASDDEGFLTKIEAKEELLSLDESMSACKWSIDLLSGFLERSGTFEELKAGVKTFNLKEIENRATAYNFKDNYKYIYELVEKRNSLEQENTNLKTTINDLKPWESLKLNIREILEFENTDVSIGTVPKKYINEFIEEAELSEFVHIEQVSKNSSFSYIICFYDKSSKDELSKIMHKYGFSRVEIKTDGNVSDAISKLENTISENNNKILEIEKKVLLKVDLLEDFKIYYEYLKNKRLKFASSEKFLKTENVDIIEGYLPTNREKELISLLDDTLGKNYYIEIEKASEDDPKVPVQLENNNFVEPFESLTTMYSIPRYNEIDPTPLFAPFYFIFAGIMVGDLGYGLLLFLATFFALKFFNLDKVKRNSIKFFMYISISTMLWGIVFGSFFGDAIPMKSLLNPSEDYVAMILMSLIFGGIHIFFALGIKAYMNIRDKKPLDALYDVGFWYMAVMGAIVCIVANVLKLKSGIFNAAMIIMVLGMIGIVLTGGRTEKTIGAKLGWGIYALYGITSYFGDFVSYLRLMALSLAGSFIAIAVNIIVRMLFQNGILGIIFGALIFLMFQLFNMFLAFLSAYVHSARLTYVEMFNKFYEGGGVPFKNMVAESNYFNIEEE
ncbi:V-type ATP synthase subunit I [Peptoniphilus mikwangii]|uniref:V-type ATP synthase subunit I n=1 Tax=Peptoniphilus mikwangii TaxID=1354300 RepID=UPI0003F608A9|nr:V-type ATP synthase subunit I [Peptoniphilus mikwangii]